MSSPSRSTRSWRAKPASTASWPRWRPSSRNRHGAPPDRGGQVSGRVRLARLTDLAALGELSRLSQAEHVDARSLGLPVSGPRMGVFSLFRLPLGAFRPNDLLFVYEDERRISGLVRVERDASRDEWTIVELDAIGSGDSGDTRFRLVQHLLRDGAKRGAIRFHVACSDRQGNPELFMQAGFARYGQERLLFRGTDALRPAAWTEEQTRAAGIRPLASAPPSRPRAEARPSRETGAAPGRTVQSRPA